MKYGTQWYFEAFRRWDDFDGRSRRMEYWTFNLVNSILFTIPKILTATIPPSGNNSILLIILFLFLIFALVLIVPTLSLSIRRLHDIGKSGWWLLIGIVPLVGPIVLFIFSVMDSQPGSNQYGPDPKGE